MTPEQGPTTGSLTIEEEFSPRAIEAFMANYRDSQQAFLELIDNAVDNRIEGHKLVVRVRVAKNELSIHNQGGSGLDLEGLRNFFKWGYSEKVAGIGFYGVGGKGAMGYLGRSMEVMCSAKGSEEEFRVFDPNWETRDEDEKKSFEADLRSAHTQDGYFRARVTNLKKEVNAQALTAKLADIYRPLLLTNQVEIKVNGKAIEPLEIKYSDDPKLRPEELMVQTRFGDSFDLKVGVMAEGQKVKPGIRCYYRGRLIEDEQFFGHPTPAQLPQASRLIGEAHLDFMPVTPNKATFIHSSAQWTHTSKRIHDVLEPWVQKLTSLIREQKTPVEGYERELAKRAKRILEHVFAESGLITKAMLPGESEGRRPSRSGGEPRVKTGRISTSEGPKEGQTAPLLDATVGKMKRWGAMHDFDIAPMGREGRRSEIVNESGRLILKVNTEHPLYQAEKKAGEEALGLYQAETAILKIAELATQGKSIEEYVELVNNLSRECGAVYYARMTQKEPRRARRRQG